MGCGPIGGPPIFTDPFAGSAFAPQLAPPLRNAPTAAAQPRPTPRTPMAAIPDPPRGAPQPLANVRPAFRPVEVPQPHELGIAELPASQVIVPAPAEFGIRGD